MLKRQYRRMTDHIFASLSHAVSEVKRNGLPSRDGSLLVAGTVKGSSSLNGMLTLLRSGRWEGNIDAKNAVVAGQVFGNITVREKLEIRKSARIHGSVRAGFIALAEGASINSDTAIMSDMPLVRFREKRRRDKPIFAWLTRLRLTALEGARTSIL